MECCHDIYARGATTTACWPTAIFKKPKNLSMFFICEFFFSSFQVQVQVLGMREFNNKHNAAFQSTSSMDYSAKSTLRNVRL